jgi:hypothetical protein
LPAQSNSSAFHRSHRGNSSSQRTKSTFSTATAPARRRIVFRFPGPQWRLPRQACSLLTSADYNAESIGSVTVNSCARTSSLQQSQINIHKSSINPRRGEVQNLT